MPKFYLIFVRLISIIVILLKLGVIVNLFVCIFIDQKQLLKQLLMLRLSDLKYHGKVLFKLYHDKLYSDGDIFNKKYGRCNCQSFCLIINQIRTEIYYRLFKYTAEVYCHNLLTIRK